MSAVETISMTEATAFALTGSRVAGFVAASPFPGKNVGGTSRVALAFAITLFAMTLSPAAPRPRSLDLRLVASGLVEVGCGLLIGVSFRFVFAAAEVLGSVLGDVTGLGSPSVLNPTLESSDTVVSRLVSLSATLFALGLGLHRVAIGAVLESLRALPVGSDMVIGAPALLFVDLAIDSFSVGVRLATPVVGVTLVVQLVLAMIARAAPSLQIFSVGFGVIFVSAMITVGASLGDMFAGLAAHFGGLASFTERALTALGP